MSEKVEFEKSSGNVFKDLGLPLAEELLLKATLGFEIFRILEDRRLTQRGFDREQTPMSSV